MSMVTRVTDAIIKFHPTTASVIGGAIAGCAAVEMALRVFKDLADIYQAHSQGANTHQYRLNLSKDLGGALFYGMLAANIVPYTAVLGATIFTVYALCKGGETDYLSAKAIWHVANALLTAVSETVQFVWKWVVTPIWVYVLSPICEIIRDVVSAIFENLISPALTILSNAIGHIIPRDPIWYGVAAVGAMIFAYYHYSQNNQPA